MQNKPFRVLLRTVIMSALHFGGLAQSHATTYTGFHRRVVFLNYGIITCKFKVYTLTTIWLDIIY